LIKENPQSYGGLWGLSSSKNVKGGDIDNSTMLMTERNAKKALGHIYKYIPPFQFCQKKCTLRLFLECILHSFVYAKPVQKISHLFSIIKNKKKNILTKYYKSSILSI